MNRSKLIRQTIFLSGSHFIVRIIGFVMRIWLSREMGAAAMGLVELAHSAQMLLITPVVSGLPAAVSRMSAKATGDTAKQTRVLRCGMALALAVSVPLCFAAFLLRAPIALWLGDIRTMPALLVYLPCIPVLGASCALNGYFYGTGKPVPPALSELLEQIVRFLLCVRLAALLKNWPLTLRAAIPAVGTLAGETIGLFLMLIFCVRSILFTTGEGSRREILREILALALPLTGMRLVSALMRTVNATLIPARLTLSGLPKGEALSQLGMLNGMVMPMLLLPSFITCSLCMVCAPELTRRQAQAKPLRLLCIRIAAAALGVGLLCMTAVGLCAPLIAEKLYRQSELLPLLRRCCPMIPMMALTQVLGGMMNGLGLQQQSLRISLLSGLVCVVITYTLAAQPGLRLWGVVIALAFSQFITLMLSAASIKQTVSLHSEYISQ